MIHLCYEMKYNCKPTNKHLGWPGKEKVESLVPVGGGTYSFYLFELFGILKIENQKQVTFLFFKI
jgi:hypothetical protein